MNALRVVFAAVAALAFGVANAQFPNKPIKIVVPFAAGSATDLTARGLAAKLQELLKQPIVVDERDPLPVRVDHRAEVGARRAHQRGDIVARIGSR